MWRWNPDTRNWDIRYTSRLLRYPPLPPHLKTELSKIESTHDGIMEYFPCLVVLENVEQHDYVYIVEAKSYIRFWGVWPDDDPAKRAIRIDDVADSVQSLAATGQLGTTDVCARRVANGLLHLYASLWRRHARIVLRWQLDRFPKNAHW